MKNVKIPVAHWHYILTQREKQRWGGGGHGGRDGNWYGWRESGRKGEIEGKIQKGSCKVGFCMCSVCVCVCS